MNKPDFSVLIPTFNRSSFLKLSLMSALRQKRVSMEVIVADDGSTDDTKDIVKAFGDQRIKYFKNKKRLGTSLNFQKCFLKSSGKFIFTLGDDDFILDENTLSEVLKVMKKYKVGMGKIGTISYETSPKFPYQISTLSDKLIVLKPNRKEDILIKSIDFGLGFYSGLIFDNNLLDKNKLKINHLCFPDHMCQVYHRVAYDLIRKHGIAYIQNYFIVAHLSLQMIPSYFNIEKHGRFFMEEPILLAKEFIDGKNYENYKKEYLRKQIILLPNIKFFSDNQNYIRVLKRLISIDKILLLDPKFLILSFVGFLPKFIIKAMRNFMIFYSKRKVTELVKRYDYFKKLEKLEIYTAS